VRVTVEPGQYTSLAFGRALRAAVPIDGSMGTAGDCFDNALAESFLATLQTELLNRHHWSPRQQPRLAVFDYVEAFYNRRHSALGYKPSHLRGDDHRPTRRLATRCPPRRVSSSSSPLTGPGTRKKVAPDGGDDVGRAQRNS